MRSRVTPTVAVGSIRPRILKGLIGGDQEARALRSCSGLDPTEDTESTPAWSRPAVASSCSGLDPTEDTESPGLGQQRRGRGELQWARSDRGY